ncbi:MAG: DUF4411 family protein [Candidatus Lokiarchaeota archaeon]|nr:DUF4411 family protein [Candidatus Lokiarchaeota archaeon]
MSIQTRLGKLYPNAKYSFDTDTYISIWRYHYSPDVFPSLYENLTEIIERGVIKSTYPVLIELERQRDEIYDYFSNFELLFVEPTEEEQKFVNYLTNHHDFDKWGGGDSEKHYADPFVVALAKIHDLKVETYETRNNLNSIGRACELLNVEICRFIDFLRYEDLIFR